MRTIGRVAYKMRIHLIRKIAAKFGYSLVLAFLGQVLFILPQTTLAKTYTIGIVPQLPKEYTQKNWGPFIHQVKKLSGVDIKIHLFASFNDFESAFTKGEPDFVYLNPYHQLIADKEQGYIPLIRDDSNKLTGILVVGKNSNIDNIQQLNHEKVAFPSPLAFGASLYMRAALLKQGVEVDPIYVKSHNNVYRSVVLGRAIAGGGVNTTFLNESEQIRHELKVIFKLPGVPSHPISVHPRVEKSIQQAFIKACMEMYKSAQGRTLLKAVHITTPIVADQDRDYRPLKALHLERIINATQMSTKTDRGAKNGG